MTIAERRHHRDRVIQRRMNIIRQAWGEDEIGWKPGQLAKHNLVCSCPMCREKKHRDSDRAALKRELRREMEETTG